MKRQMFWAIEKVEWNASKQLTVTTIVDEYDLYTTKEAAQKECDKYNAKTVEQVCSFYFHYVRKQVSSWLASDRSSGLAPLTIAGANSVPDSAMNPYYYPVEVTVTIYD